MVEDLVAAVRAADPADYGEGAGLFLFADDLVLVAAVGMSLCHGCSPLAAWSVSGVIAGGACPFVAPGLFEARLSAARRVRVFQRSYGP